MLFQKKPNNQNDKAEDIISKTNGYFLSRNTGKYQNIKSDFGSLSTKVESFFDLLNILDIIKNDIWFTNYGDEQSKTELSYIYEKAKILYQKISKDEFIKKYIDKILNQSYIDVQKGLDSDSFDIYTKNFVSNNQKYIYTSKNKSNRKGNVVKVIGGLSILFGLSSDAIHSSQVAPFAIDKIPKPKVIHVDKDKVLNDISKALKQIDSLSNMYPKKELQLSESQGGENDIDGGFSGEAVTGIVNNQEYSNLKSRITNKDKVFFDENMRFLDTRLSNFKKNIINYYAKHKKGDIYEFTFKNKKGIQKIIENESDYKNNLNKLVRFEEAMKLCKSMLISVRGDEYNDRDLYIFFDDIILTHLGSDILGLYHKKTNLDKNIHLNLSNINSREEFLSTLVHEFAHAVMGVSDNKIRNEGGAEYLSTSSIFHNSGKDLFDPDHDYAESVFDFITISSTYGGYDGFESFEIKTSYNYSNTDNNHENMLYAQSLFSIIKKYSNSSIDPNFVIFMCGGKQKVSDNITKFAKYSPKLGKYIKLNLDLYDESKYFDIENSKFSSEDKLSQALLTFYKDNPGGVNGLNIDISGYGVEPDVVFPSSITQNKTPEKEKEDDKKKEKDEIKPDSNQNNNSNNNGSDNNNFEKGKRKTLESVRQGIINDIDFWKEEDIKYYKDGLRDLHDFDNLMSTLQGKRLDSLINTKTKEILRESIVGLKEDLSKEYKSKSGFSDIYDHEIDNFLATIDDENVGDFIINMNIDINKSELSAAAKSQMLHTYNKNNYVSYIDNDIFEYIKSQIKLNLEQKNTKILTDIKIKTKDNLDKLGVINNTDKVFKTLEDVYNGIIKNQGKIYAIVLIYLIYLNFRKRKNSNKLKNKLSEIDKGFNEEIMKKYNLNNFFKSVSNYAGLGMLIVLFGIFVNSIDGEYNKIHKSFGLTKQNIAITDREFIFEDIDHKYSREMLEDIHARGDPGSYKRAKEGVKNTLKKYISKKHNIYYDFEVDIDDKILSNLVLRGKKTTESDVYNILNGQKIAISIKNDYETTIKLFLVISIFLSSLYLGKRRLDKNIKKHQSIVDSLDSGDIFKIFDSLIDISAIEYDYNIKKIVESIKIGSKNLLKYSTKKSIIKFIHSDIYYKEIFFTNVNLLKNIVSRNSAIESADGNNFTNSYTICLNFSKKNFTNGLSIDQVHKDQNEKLVYDKLAYLDNILDFTVSTISKLNSGSDIQIQYFIDGSYISKSTINIKNESINSKDQLIDIIKKYIILSIGETITQDQKNLNSTYKSSEAGSRLDKTKNIFIGFDKDQIDKEFSFISKEDLMTLNI